MQIAINQTNINFDFLSMFSDFLKSVIENYKCRHETYNLEKRVNKIIDTLLFLNNNIKTITTIPEFDKLEDELIDMKFYLENKIDTLPKHLQTPFKKLYETLSLLIFNLSMYEMNNEIENYRNEKI